MANDNKSIIRTVKDRENPYVMLDKHFLSDDRLSWKAKGLLAYFLSKPDNWRIMIEDLIKQSTDGEKAVRTGLKELELCGYLENIPQRNEKGQVMYWEKRVHERPLNMEIQPDSQNGNLDKNPDSDFLHVENLHVEKDGLLINDSTNNLLKPNNKKTTTTKKKGTTKKAASLPKHPKSQNNVVVSPIISNFLAQWNLEIDNKTLGNWTKKANEETILRNLQAACSNPSIENVIGAVTAAIKGGYIIGGQASQRKTQGKPKKQLSQKQQEILDKYRKAGLK